MLSKTKLSDTKIKDLIHQQLGGDLALKSIEELIDGYFNSAYKLSFFNHPPLVLKVAPSKDFKGMRLEKDIMATEVYTLKALSDIPDFPVPTFYAFDSSKALIDNAYFFMSWVEGKPLDKCRPQLSDSATTILSRELGHFTQEIHHVKGSKFGYINDENRQFDKWSHAFFFMIGELLDDARDAKITLPFDTHEFYQKLQGLAGLLDAVKEPCLLHKDLWDGNILIDPESYDILGIIDCERALWGDPVLDLVCGFHDENPDFLKAYMQKDTLTDMESARALVYKIYLMLIIIIEDSYRQYSDHTLKSMALDALAPALQGLDQVLQAINPDH